MKRIQLAFNRFGKAREVLWGCPFDARERVSRRNTPQGQAVLLPNSPIKPTAEFLKGNGDLYQGRLDLTRAAGLLSFQYPLSDRFILDQRHHKHFLKGNAKDLGGILPNDVRDSGP